MVGSSCRAPQSILETGPRFPDDEGVVTDVSFERVELDGERRYGFSAATESFTTSGKQAGTSVLSWQNRFVQIGTTTENRSEVVIWIAGIGFISATDPPIVTYSGTFLGVEKGRAIFEDGTTLKVEKSVKLPDEGTLVVASLNADNKVVVEFQQAR